MVQVEELGRRVAHDRAGVAVVVREAPARRVRLEHVGHAAQARAVQRLKLLEQRAALRAQPRAGALEEGLGEEGQLLEWRDGAAGLDDVLLDFAQLPSALARSTVAVVARFKSRVSSLLDFPCESLTWIRPSLSALAARSANTHSVRPPPRCTSAKLA